ncbi:MAG: PDZ domain-containing protein, partial [Bdellovibrionota bacterium]
MSALERAAVLLLSALGLALIVLSAMDGAKRVEAPFRGFAAMEGPLVTPFSSPAWSGERAGLKPLDIVEKADGRTVASLSELDALVAGKQPGEAIEYEVQRFGAGKETVRVPVMTLSAGDLWGYLFPIALTGIAYIAIGLIVYFFKPGTAIGRLFFVSSAFLGFTTALDFEFATVGSFSRLWMITGPIAIATGTLLLFHYPEKSRWLDRFPWLSKIAPLPPLLFALGFQTQLHRPERMIFLIGGYSFYTMGVLLLGGLLVWDTYRRSVSPLVRMRVRILGVPFVVLAPFAVLAAAAALLADLWLPVHYVAVLSVLYPAFMAYGLTQYNLFEVASFVRRAVGYSVATTAVVLSFSVLLLLTQAGARMVLGHEAAQETPILSALATVLLFLPLWRSSQGLVDRLFYRERADLQKILAHTSETLVRSFDAPETAKVCALAIQKALSPEFLTVFLRGEDGNWWPVIQEGELPPAAQETRIDDNHPLIAVLSKER